MTCDLYIAFTATMVALVRSLKAYIVCVCVCVHLCTYICMCTCVCLFVCTGSPFLQHHRSADDPKSAAYDAGGSHGF